MSTTQELIVPAQPVVAMKNSKGSSRGRMDSVHSLAKSKVTKPKQSSKSSAAQKKGGLMFVPEDPSHRKTKEEMYAIRSQVMYNWLDKTQQDQGTEQSAPAPNRQTPIQPKPSRKKSASPKRVQSPPKAAARKTSEDRPTAPVVEEPLPAPVSLSADDFAPLPISVPIEDFTLMPTTSSSDLPIITDADIEATIASTLPQYTTAIPSCEPDLSYLYMPEANPLFSVQNATSPPYQPPSRETSQELALRTRKNSPSLKQWAHADRNRTLHEFPRGAMNWFEYGAAYPGLAIERQIGRTLDPFRTLPQSTNTVVNVEELKWNCIRIFGTRAMAKAWVPHIIADKSAFLSTLSITSTHLDIYQKNVRGPSEESRAVNDEVSWLVEHAVDPYSDQTILTLMQLACSEIVFADVQRKRSLELGLTMRVQWRGGLEALGLNGHLATTLAIVVLLSSVLDEEQPHPMYMEYHPPFRAPSPRRRAPCYSLPISPLYCPQGVFSSLNCSERCIGLLNDMRQLTLLWTTLTNPSTNANDLSFITWQIDDIIHRLHTSTTSSQSSLNNLAADHVYESIRLASLIYANSIQQRLPLSRLEKHPSAPHHQNPYFSNLTSSPESLHHLPIYQHNHHHPAQLPTPLSMSSYPSPASTSSHTLSATPSVPLTKLLKTALSHTTDKLSDCWGDMAGVLYWITLVGGAAARGTMEGKWFAAVAVRCSIVLGFEHGSAVFDSLREMVGVQGGLKGWDVSGGAQGQQEFQGQGQGQGVPRMSVSSGNGSGLEQWMGRGSVSLPQEWQGGFRGSVSQGMTQGMGQEWHGVPVSVSLPVPRGSVSLTQEQWVSGLF